MKAVSANYPGDLNLIKQFSTLVVTLSCNGEKTSFGCGSDWIDMYFGSGVKLHTNVYEAIDEDEK